MDKKQQIEEMAKLCCPFQFNEKTCFDEHCNDTGCWALPIAETLYNAGYRKESETAKEIFNKLIKIAEDEFKGSLPFGVLKAWALEYGVEKGK